MITGSLLAAAGGIGLVVVKLSFNGVVDTLKTAVPLDENSKAGQFGYIQGVVKSDKPVVSSNNKEFGAVKNFLFQRRYQYGAIYETKELISGPTIECNSLQIVKDSLELSLNHGFLKHMNFSYVGSVNNNDGDGLVENITHVMIGNRMRFGTIKETYGIELGSPYTVYGEKIGTTLFPKDGYEDLIFTGFKSHQSVIANKEREINMWNLACFGFIGVGVGIMTMASRN